MACRYKSPFEVVQDNVDETFDTIDLDEFRKIHARKSYVLFQTFIPQQLSTSKSVDVTSKNKTLNLTQRSRKHLHNDKAGILLANAKKNVRFCIGGQKYGNGYDY